MQQQEQVALLLGGEAVEQQRVVAHDQVRVQRDRPARRRGPGAASRPRRRAGSRRRRTSTTTWSGAADGDLAGERARSRDWPPAGPRACAAARALAWQIGDGERVGGVVGPRQLGRATSSVWTIRCTWSLAGAAGAADRALDLLRRVGRSTGCRAGRRRAARRRAPGRPRTPSARWRRSRAPRPRPRRARARRAARPPARGSSASRAAGSAPGEVSITPPSSADQPPAAARDDAVARVGGAGIDAEDEHPTAGILRAAADASRERPAERPAATSRRRRRTRSRRARSATRDRDHHHARRARSGGACARGRRASTSSTPPAAACRRRARCMRPW